MINQVAPKFGAGCCTFQGNLRSAQAQKAPQQHFGINLSEAVNNVAGKIAPKQDGARLNLLA